MDLTANNMVKKGLTIKQIVNILVIVGVVIVGIGSIVLPNLLNKQENLSMRVPRAQYATPTPVVVGSCDVQIVIPTPTVTPTLTPVPPTPTVPPCTDNPVDIVLALDRSGTMGTTDVNGVVKFTAEKNAALAFISLIESQSTASRNNVRIGVVAWAGNNYRVTTLPLTNSLTGLTTIRNFISNVSYTSSDQYTCLECSVARSADLLSGSLNRKYVIMMSDGIGNRNISSCTSYNAGNNCTNPTPPTCTSNSYLQLHCPLADTTAINVADAKKTSGVFYHVIGYGKNVSPVTILENNLKSICGDNIGSNNPDDDEFYHYAGDNTLDWAQIFASIAPQICGETLNTYKSVYKK